MGKVCHNRNRNEKNGENLVPYCRLSEGLFGHNKEEILHIMPDFRGEKIYYMYIAIFPGGKTTNSVFRGGEVTYNTTPAVYRAVLGCYCLIFTFIV